MAEAEFQVPARCDLAQLAHWFAERIQPIPQELYSDAPLVFDVNPNDLRNLYIELRKAEFDLRGDLVGGAISHWDHVEFLNGEKPVTDLEFESWATLQKNVPIKFSLFTLNDIDFSKSRIFAEDGLGFETLESDEDWKRRITKYEENLPDHRNMDPYERVREYYARFFYDVTVDFSKFRSAVTGLPSGPKKQPVQQTGRGRPPKYNWDTIWAEIAVRADLDGLPDKQDDFIKTIQEWYQARFNEEPPSRETLKPKLSKVYRHYRKSKPDS